MKRIMFTQTDDVLAGRKTMTRRIVGGRMTKDDLVAIEKYPDLVPVFSYYKVGEVAAVAQSYAEILAKCIHKSKEKREFIIRVGKCYDKYANVLDIPGWTNKMFIRPGFMPHRVMFTDVFCQRLQDITDEDCMKEGILFSKEYAMPYGIPDTKAPNGFFFFYDTPREAYAALIDKISGKGTWESNPLVFAYSFKLI